MVCLVSQPTVTATPKATKNGKPGYDDTTLPLMEKNQGLCVCVCVERTKWAGYGRKDSRGSQQNENPEFVPADGWYLRFYQAGAKPRMFKSVLKMTVYGSQSWTLDDVNHKKKKLLNTWFAVFSKIQKIGHFGELFSASHERRFCGSKVYMIFSSHEYFNDTTHRLVILLTRVFRRFWSL